MAPMVAMARMPTRMNTTDSDDISPAGLLRLFQLVSPALPIGAYTYSQGLEYAVERGWVGDEHTARDWILGQIEHALPHLDLPVLRRLYDACHRDDWDGWLTWSRFLQASRESAELLAEDRHLGQALAQLLEKLDEASPLTRIRRQDMSFAGCYAYACVHWQIPRQQAARGYLWIWAEGQVAAAIKLVPLGQTAGQRILSQIIERIPAAVELGFLVEDQAIGRAAPALAIASARHETQYTRLFRS